MAKHLRLSSYSGSSMIIQQQLPYVLSGSYRSNSDVKFELERFPVSGKTVSPLDTDYGVIISSQTKCGEDGSFSIELPPLEASFDHYSLTISAGKEIIIFEEILVGEVWVFAGHAEHITKLDQSFSHQKITEYANMHYIRFLTQSEDGLKNKRDSYSCDKQVNLNSAAWVCGDDADRLGNINTQVYFFARSLLQELKLPVAVIDVSMAASFIHSWLSRETIEQNTEIKSVIEKYGFYRDENTWHMAGDWGCHLPGALYNHKIAPLTGLGIRGVIWLQGMKDRLNADYYRTCLKQLIYDWQRVFRVPADKPRSQVPGTDLAEAGITGRENDDQCAWLLQQCPPAACPSDQDGFIQAEYIEAVSELSHQLNLPIAVLPVYNLLQAEATNTDDSLVSDNGNNSQPRYIFDQKAAADASKQIALGLLYHRKASCSSPECSSIEMVGSKMLLSFSNAAEGLKIRGNGNRVRGFTICGEDRVFREAQARILYGVRVMVWHDEISSPQAVSYAYCSMNYQANLVNSEQLPVVPFRSDRVKSVYSQPLEWVHCDNLRALAVKKLTELDCRSGSGDIRLLPVWEIKEGEAEVKLDEANKQEGDASLLIKYKAASSGAAVKIGPVLSYGSMIMPYDLSLYDQILLDIFNPDRQMKQIWLESGSDKTADSDSLKLSSRQTVIGALRWQTLSFSINDFIELDSENKRILRDLSICLADSRANGSFYLDNIRFIRS